jgi:hypothetical protein
MVITVAVVVVVAVAVAVVAVVAVVVVDRSTVTKVTYTHNMSYTGSNKHTTNIFTVTRGNNDDVNTNTIIAI